MEFREPSVHSWRCVHTYLVSSNVCARESVESGRLMAADVWLVGPVGLILGSNGSFSDAWVSLLSLVGTELYIGAGTSP